MTIETKFSLGDKAVFINNNEVLEGCVSAINAEVIIGHSATIAYTVIVRDTLMNGQLTGRPVAGISENRVFKDKAALVESLMK